jgi:predicted O-methyltransferase YrrM
VNPTRRDVLLVSTLGVGVAALVWLASLLGTGIALAVGTALGTSAIVGVVVEVHHRIMKVQNGAERHLIKTADAHYRQIESLFSIYAVAKPSAPVPPMRSWAASPDLLRKITEIIFETKPNVVLEAGSGVSTIVSAYCLQRLGSGTLASLEHDPKFADSSRSNLAYHGLDKVAQVIDAPLKQTQVGDMDLFWYSLDNLHLDHPVDLLVVDGPPGFLGNQVRYPTLPILFRFLSPRAIIVLDDGGRADEKAIAERWQKEFDCFSCEFLDLEKGAFLFRRRK